MILVVVVAAAQDRHRGDGLHKVLGVSERIRRAEVHIGEHEVGGGVRNARRVVVLTHARHHDEVNHVDGPTASLDRGEHDVELIVIQAGMLHVREVHELEVDWLAGTDVALGGGVGGTVGVAGVDDRHDDAAAALAVDGDDADAERAGNPQVRATDVRVEGGDLQARVAKDLVGDDFVRGGIEDDAPVVAHVNGLGRRLKRGLPVSHGREARRRLVCDRGRTARHEDLLLRGLDGRGLASARRFGALGFGGNRGHGNALPGGRLGHRLELQRRRLLRRGRTTCGLRRLLHGVLAVDDHRHILCGGAIVNGHRHPLLVRRTIRLRRETLCARFGLASDGACSHVLRLHAVDLVRDLLSVVELHLSVFFADLLPVEGLLLGLGAHGGGSIELRRAAQRRVVHDLQPSDDLFQAEVLGRPSPVLHRLLCGSLDTVPRLVLGPVVAEGAVLPALEGVGRAEEEHADHDGDLGGIASNDMRQLVGARAHAALVGEAKADRQLEGALYGDRPDSTDAHANREARNQVEREGESGVAVVPLPLARVEGQLFRTVLRIGSRVEARTQRDGRREVEVEGDEDGDASQPEVLRDAGDDGNEHLARSHALEDRRLFAPLCDDAQLQVDRRLDRGERLDGHEFASGHPTGIRLHPVCGALLCAGQTFFHSLYAIIPPFVGELAGKRLPSLALVGRLVAGVPVIAHRGSLQRELVIPEGVEVLIHVEVGAKALDFAPTHDRHPCGPLDVRHRRAREGRVDGPDHVFVRPRLVVCHALLNGQLDGTEDVVLSLHHLDVVLPLLRQGAFGTGLQVLAHEGRVEDAVVAHV